MRNIKLFEVPFGHKFTWEGSTYVHVRGNGMYPWIRKEGREALQPGYIGMVVTYDPAQ